MNLRTPMIVSFVLIAAMAAVSAWGWGAVPEHAQIVVHWGVDGRPNGFLPKTAGLLMLPAVAIALTGLFVLIPRIEPRRVNLFSSRKLYLAGWYGGLGILTVAHILTVMNAAGHPVDTPRWMIAALALLLLALGNFMGKSRSTFFVGLRLPWTLTSEVAWEKSSRIAGRGLVATGLATLLALILAGTAYGAAISAVGAALSFTIGGAVSYVAWKRDANRSNGDSVHE